MATPNYGFEKRQKELAKKKKKEEKLKMKSERKAGEPHEAQGDELENQSENSIPASNEVGTDSGDSASSE